MWIKRKSYKKAVIETFILVIYDESKSRYVPVQFFNIPDFSVFDLPHCLEAVKERAKAPLIAVEIFFGNKGNVEKIKYLAGKD